MDLETKISNFFYLSKKMFTLHQLERIFTITDNEKDTFFDTLSALVDKKVILQKNCFLFYVKILKNKKIYPLNQLEKIFKINDFNRVKFYNCLNELEMQGKIFCLEGKSFVHVPEESYLKSGCLMQSNQGNYYIKVDDEIISSSTFI